MPMIDIKGTGLSKPTVLAALFNAAAPCRMSWLEYGPKPMTSKDAANYLPNDGKIGILLGRQLYVDLSGDQFDPTDYDDANVSGLAEHVIESIAEHKEPYDNNIIGYHQYNLDRQAEKTLEQIKEDREAYAEDRLNVGLVFASRRIEMAIRMNLPPKVAPSDVPMGTILQFRPIVENVEKVSN